MKKFIAILLSVLMLCSVIPFATVAAADEPTVQLSIVDELESVNAGEEFQVQVDLLGLEDTAGLIGANVQIGYDPAAFELVTYFDEDEEMWMPPIEVGSKYNASSNKYIMYGQIDEETGAMEDCLVKYMRATASATQVRREEHFYTVTFKVKDDAPSGTYNLDVIKMEGVFHGNVYFNFIPVNTSIVVIGSEPSCTHEYDNDCDADCNLCGETREVAGHNYVGEKTTAPTCGAAGEMTYTCANCGDSYTEEIAATGAHEYFYACDAYCMNCGEETNPNAAHNVIHVEAKEAVSCIEPGNVEYWHCDACGTVWLDETLRRQTNMMSVRVAGECVSDAEYACQDGNCVNCGLPCAAEADHEYFYPCDKVCMVCFEETNPNATHTIVAVEAKDATCTATGNIAYWYCSDCGAAWADEALTIVTNQMSVIVPMTEHRFSNLVVTSATCFEAGYITITCGDCGSVFVSGVDAEADQYLIDYPFFDLDPKHTSITHVEAVAPTCTALGNIEFWYCEACGQAWLDEACTLNTNLMAVKLPMAEHTYDNVYDADCNVCGAERSVTLPITFGGNSVSVDCDGLAFKFDAAVEGIVIGEGYIADYSNATVDGYKLVMMGAIMNNKGYENQTLENVDDKYVLNVEAKKVFDDNGTSYAIRIINIPDEHLDTVITARSYFIYENANGEQFVVYGEDIATSYNAELNG